MAVADREVETPARAAAAARVACPVPPPNGAGRRAANTDGGKNRTIAGYAALAVALIACPCHLPLTLGVAAALLGGGTVVAALAENAAVFAAAAVVFAAALGLAYRLLWARDSGAV